MLCNWGEHNVLGEGAQTEKIPDPLRNFLLKMIAQLHVDVTRKNLTPFTSRRLSELRENALDLSPDTNTQEHKQAYKFYD